MGWKFSSDCHNATSIIREGQLGFLPVTYTFRGYDNECVNKSWIGKRSSSSWCYYLTSRRHCMSMGPCRFGCEINVWNNQQALSGNNEDTCMPYTYVATWYYNDSNNCILLAKWCDCFTSCLELDSRVISVINVLKRSIVLVSSFHSVEITQCLVYCIFSQV